MDRKKIDKLVKALASENKETRDTAIKKLFSPGTKPIDKIQILEECSKGLIEPSFEDKMDFLIYISLLKMRVKDDKTRLKGVKGLAPVPARYITPALPALAKAMKDKNPKIQKEAMKMVAWSSKENDVSSTVPTFLKIARGETTNQPDAILWIAELAKNRIDISSAVGFLKKRMKTKLGLEPYYVGIALTGHYILNHNMKEVYKLMHGKNKSVVLGCITRLGQKKDLKLEGKVLSSLVALLGSGEYGAGAQFAIERMSLTDRSIADKVIEEVKKQKLDKENPCVKQLFAKYNGAFNFDNVPKKEWEWDVEESHDCSGSKKGVNTNEGYLTWYNEGWDKGGGGMTIFIQSYSDFLKNGPDMEEVPENVVSELKAILEGAHVTNHKDEFDEIEKQLGDESKEIVEESAIKIFRLVTQGRDVSRFIPKLVKILKERTDLTEIAYGIEQNRVLEVLGMVIDRNKANADKVIEEIKKQKADAYANRLMIKYEGLYKFENVPKKDWMQTSDQYWTKGIHTYEGYLTWYARSSNQMSGTSETYQSYSDFLKNGPVEKGIPKKVLDELKEVLSKARNVKKINRCLEAPNEPFAIAKVIADLENYDSFPIAPNEANDAILVLLELMKGREYAITMKLLVKELKNQLKIYKEKKKTILFTANGMMEFFKKAATAGIDISPAVPDIKKYAKLDQFGKKDAEDALKEFANRKMKK
ncbi:MAG: hypothetical protein ABII22_03255 [Candidatus Micrarchaeota archaeon]